MNPTLLRIIWTDLKRDRTSLMLTFLLPLIFFSIFGVVFSGSGGSDGPSVRAVDVIVVDEDDTPVSRRLVDALDRQAALSVERSSADRDSVAQLVRTGAADAALFVGAGFESRFGTFDADRPRVELVFDPANPVARHTIGGLVQAASFQAAPEALMERGIEYIETFGGELTDAQRGVVDNATAAMQALRPGGASDSTTAASFDGLVAVEATSVREFGIEKPSEKSRSMSAYYAAGIGVMFLLFSLTGAAGGLLWEEQSGTLERVLSTNVSIRSLLTARWFFYAVVGLIQVVLMFVWAWAVFDLDLFAPNRLPAAVLLAAVTSTAASAFGVMMATLCRSQAQLSGISTVVILVMSAIGGSMMPRFIMPEFMNTAAKFTFNGWALDGFLKVFWYDDPRQSLVQALGNLRVEFAVLAVLTVVFLSVAFRLGRRWESA